MFIDGIMLRIHFLSMTTVQLGKFYPRESVSSTESSISIHWQKTQTHPRPESLSIRPKIYRNEKSEKGKKNGGRRRQSSDIIIRIAVE
mgnify:CR=1 FL=1